MVGSDEMEIFEERVGEVVILEPRGRIDSGNAKEFGKRMTTLMNAGERCLMLDFSRLTFISSAGFRALLVAGKCADQTDCSFVLCHVKGKIRQLFDLGGILDLFQIHPDRETALSSLQ